MEEYFHDPSMPWNQDYPHTRPEPKEGCDKCENCKCDTPKEVNNEFEKIKFTYLGNRKNAKDHSGIIIIASTVNEKDCTIDYGVSYCSPKDTYDKQKGRRMAFDRVHDNYVVVRRKNHTHILQHILADIISQNEYPEWAEYLIVNNLVYISDHGNML